MSLIALPGIITAQQQLLGVPPAIGLSRTTHSTNSAGDTTFTNARLPVGIQDGDVLLMAVGCARAGNGGAIMSSAESMTELQTNNHNGTLMSVNSTLWWIKYNAALHGTTPFSFTAAQARGWTIHAMVLQMANDVDPKDGSTFIDDNGTPIPIPTITPSVKSTIGFEIFCSRSNETDGAAVTSIPTGAILVLNETNWTMSNGHARHRFVIHYTDHFTTTATGERSYALTDLAIASIQRTAAIHVLLKR